MVASKLRWTEGLLCYFFTLIITSLQFWFAPLISQHRKMNSMCSMATGLQWIERESKIGLFIHLFENNFHSGRNMPVRCRCPEKDFRKHSLLFAFLNLVYFINSGGPRVLQRKPSKSGAGGAKEEMRLLHTWMDRPEAATTISRDLLS